MPLAIPTNFEDAQVQYGRKVKTFARNSAYAVPGYTQADMEQELLIVLWECVRNYNPDRGAGFNTYFQRSAKNRIITLIRHASTKGRKADVVTLNDDAVMIAVERIFVCESSEATAMRKMEVVQALKENPHGLEGRRGRKPKQRTAA